MDSIKDKKTEFLSRAPDFMEGQYDYTHEAAYEIEEGEFGVFAIRKTANAWWLNRTKVERLIEGKKYGFNDREACYFAGITKRQLDYFLTVHPDFCELFELLPMNPRILAKMTIVKNLANPDTARWFAEHAMRDEFSKKIVPENPGNQNEELPADLKAAAMRIARMSPEERERRLERLRKIGG